MQIKLIFERKVLHLASFWKLEFSELVKGLSIDTCKHSQCKLSSLLSSDKKLSNLRLSNIITLLTASFSTEFWFIFLNVTNYIIHVEYWKKKENSRSEAFPQLSHKQAFEVYMFPQA